MSLDTQFSENVAVWPAHRDKKQKNRSDFYLVGLSVCSSPRAQYIRDQSSQGTLGPGPGGQKVPGVDGSSWVLPKRLGQRGQEFRLLALALRPATHGTLDKVFTLFTPELSMETLSVLPWAPPEAGPDTSILAQVVYFQGDTGKRSNGVGKTGKGRHPIKIHEQTSATVGTWSQ